jgi:hypothetical protein
MISCLQLVYASKYDIRFVEGYSGPVIVKARNELVYHFLTKEEDAEYLLFADTDMVFNDEILDLLLKADKDIASALYYAPYPGVNDMNPVALVLDEKGKFAPLELAEDIDPELPVEVQGVGMGFCLIKRTVLEKMAANPDLAWPFAEEIINGQWCGEDLTFCLRASEHGFKTYVIPAARAGHRKTFTV